MRFAELNKNLLAPIGWVQSNIRKAPLAPDGTPLPWFTYGAIEFLSRIVRPTDVVFEFGAGYSTLWWQERVAEIVSVEHDNLWCASIGKHIKSNVKLMHLPANHSENPAHENAFSEFFSRNIRMDFPYDSERKIRRGLEDRKFLAYAAEIRLTNRKYDFIVVDGMARRLCTFAATDRIKDDGFIVFDNSFRSDYKEAFEILEEKGFYEIPFLGLVPGESYFSCTSVFFKKPERIPRAGFRSNVFGLNEY